MSAKSEIESEKPTFLKPLSFMKCKKKGMPSDSELRLAIIAPLYNTWNNTGQSVSRF